MNKNTKRIKREAYKACVASTGHPPQYIENKRKKQKVACLTSKDGKRLRGS